MPVNPWNPDQYARYAAERSQPFYDLLALVRPVLGGRVVDLGCGTGDLTRVLHDRTEARETVGVDSSASMLAKATDGGGVRFVRQDLREHADGPYDVVFSNAALQWCDDHEALFADVARLLAPGGQLAVQMPANHGELPHVVAAEVAGEAPFADAMTEPPRRSPVLGAVDYAHLLHRIGLVDLRVRLEVYCHLLTSRDDVVEWVRGTLLTDYQRKMPAELFPVFLARYRERLLPQLADERPFLFPFQRLLLYGRRPE